MSMTDEQIRQNAVKYSEQHCSGHVDGSLVDSYIAGAHSRDEEIQKLKRLYEEALHKYYESECKLRNPWISVENRLPEKLENACVSDSVLTRIGGPRQVWYLVNRYNYDIKSWEGCNIFTTHWMPIPEVNKTII